MKNRTLPEKFAAVYCNVITFVVVFLIITFFAAELPDMIWISGRIVAAVAIAVWFGTKYPSMKASEVFLRSVIQDLLAYIFRYQLADFMGVSTSSPLWEFEYIGLVYGWICRLAVIQPMAIIVKRKVSDKNKQPPVI